MRRLLLTVLLLSVALAAVHMPTVAAQPATPAYVVNEATYTAKAGEKKFEISAVYQVELLRSGMTAIRLLPPDAAITDFSTNKLPISSAKFFLRRTGSGCEALIDREGKYEIRIDFVVRIDRSGKTARAVVPFPMSSRNELTLHIPESGIKIAVKPDMPIEITGESKTATTARLFPPAIEKLELEWYPKTLAKEREAVMVAEDRSFCTFSDGILRRATHFRYTITRGKVSSLALRLPKDASIRDLKGDLVEKWTATDRTVDIKLKQEVETSFGITLLTEEPTAPVPAVVKVEPVATVDAGRQRGAMAMLAERGLRLRHRGALNARQADIGAARFQGTDLPVRLAYAYDSLPAEVSVGVERAVAKIAAESESHVELERGIVTIQSNFNYDIKDAGVYEFRLKLHKGLAVLAVRGGIVKSAPRRGKGGKILQDENGVLPNVQLQPLDTEVKGDILTVRTREQAMGRYMLQVVAQMNLVKVNGVVIPRIETLGTESETGYIGISVGAGVNLQHHTATKTRQIDVDRLPAWLVARGCKIGYTYTQRGGTLSVRTIKIEPEITAKAYEYVAIEENWVRQEVLYALDVAKAGLFSLRLRIPQGMTVTEVRGQGIEDWTFAEDTREVRVELGAEIRGGYAFQVFAERRIHDLKDDIPLGGIELLGTKKLEGWLGVGPRASVDLRAEKRERLQKLGIERMPKFYQAYPEMIMAYTYSRGNWTLQLRTIILQPRIEVETFSLLRFQSGIMMAEEEVHIDIKTAEVKALDLLLPPKAVNAGVEGDDIKTSELINGTYHVTLRNRMKGKLVLAVRYDQALGGASGKLTFTGVKVAKAYAQKGFIIVVKVKGDADIKPRVIRAVTPVDESTLPADIAKRVAFPIVRTYRYSGPDRAVAFDVTSLARADVAKAEATSCLIKTVVKPRGEAVNYLRFHVANKQKQFLQVNLGEKASLWGAYIRGEPVRCNQRADGSILIPIMSKGGPNKSFDVSVVWSNPLPKLGLMRTIDFISPDPDVQVGKVQWDVFFPRDYRIRGTSGNMHLLSTGARDVSLVAILWSYLSGLLTILGSLLIPAAVLAVFAGIGMLMWLLRRSKRAPAFARGVIILICVLALGFTVFSLLTPKLLRSRSAARECAKALKQPTQPMYELSLESPQHDKSRKYSVRSGAARRITGIATATDEIGVVRQEGAVAKGGETQTRYTSDRAREWARKMDASKKSGRVAGLTGADEDGDGLVDRPAKAPQERAAAELPKAQAPAPVQQPQQMLLRKKTKSKKEIVRQKVQQMESNDAYNKAVLNMRQNRLDDAERDLNRALSLNKGNVQARQQLAKIQGMRAVAGEQIKQSEQLVQQQRDKDDLSLVKAKRRDPFSRTEKEALKEEVEERQAVAHTGDRSSDEKKPQVPGKRIDGVTIAEPKDASGRPAGASGPSSAEIREKTKEIRRLVSEGKREEAKKLMEDLRRRRVRKAKPMAKPADKEVDAPAVVVAPEPAKAPMSPAAKRLAVDPAVRVNNFYRKGVKLYNAGEYQAAHGFFQQVADSGIDLGAQKTRRLAAMLANTRSRLSTVAFGTKSALATAAVQAQIAQQQKDVQRQGEAETMLTQVVGGKAKGALPIDIRFPIYGTVPYTFELPVAGDTQGQIRMSCIRIGAALCLQGIIGLAVLAAALCLGWRRGWRGFAVCLAALVLLYSVWWVASSPASSDYYLIAIVALVLALIILGIRTAAQDIVVARSGEAGA